MTAPTIGFGATRPQPRRARSRARSMAARSAGVPSESEPNADTSEGMCRLGIEVRELRGEGLAPARLQANLAHELHGREGESAVDEHHGTGIGGVDHHRPRARRAVVEPDVRTVRLVTIDPDSGGDIDEGELPPCDRAIAVTPQIHGEFEVVTRARCRPQGAVPEPRNGAVHPAHRDRGDGEAALEDADPHAVAEPER